MKDKLFGIILFWMAASLPVLGIFMIKGFFSNYWFVTSLLIYALIYRPILHILRLLNLKAIEEKEAWKFFIPFYQTKYIKTLWFG